MTKKDFLTGKTNPVNKELMSIFLQFEIVEHSGHGVPIIVRDYGEKAYEFLKSFITINIPPIEQALMWITQNKKY